MMRLRPETGDEIIALECVGRIDSDDYQDFMPTFEDAIARAVKEAGGGLLRGGAYKPRTSPHSFQGLGEKGLEILEEVGLEALETEIEATFGRLGEKVLAANLDAFRRGMALR